MLAIKECQLIGETIVKVEKESLLRSGLQVGVMLA